ncbi:tRNA lysidine(34) synthetase TilS [Nocardioides donggukensis]|uniref:tRNA(Ile)-lysidine synthase n=1 Tax=Nocardioides donggukensis TaxID=2774019 RepID=A0A927KAZ5_9ACTN|nr:tRNA lysidine(34) synthetase TilS [Nocardioides donggukensis]MBD8870880.1 tRNA lysidine(34) synthetase TilS [Nocardioides donggukensis]
MALDPAVAAVRRAVRRDLAEVAEVGPVLVACSGGADSVALLSAAVFECHRAGRRVVGATVDHGLQEDSAEHAASVVAQMATMGADETVSARVRADAPGLGPEAAAREARYAVLREMAQRFGAAAVLLGHTRDDQAETVLLGLARGSGGRSIAGMRRAFEVFRRPLLEVSRADTASACDAEGLPVWGDPHNEDPAYTRARVRHRVLPVLEAELGPGVAVSLARTADLLRPDMELLDDLADQALARVRRPAPTAYRDPALDVVETGGLPAPVRRRVLRSAALAAGAPASELFLEHVAGMDRLLTAWRGQKWVDLPGHLRLLRVGGLLVFAGGAPAGHER